MRAVAFYLLGLILTATTLSASERLPTDGYVPNVVQPQVVETPLKTDALPHLNKVTVRESAAANDAVAPQLGPSGSFWWLVGVIVVSGVLLAIIL